MHSICVIDHFHGHIINIAHLLKGRQSGCQVRAGLTFKVSQHLEPVHHLGATKPFKARLCENAPPSFKTSMPKLRHDSAVNDIIDDIGDF